MIAALTGSGTVLSTFTVESVERTPPQAPDGAPWILEGSTWNDTGGWDDDETWND